MAHGWAKQEPAFNVHKYSSLFTVTGEKKLFPLNEGVNNFSSYLDISNINNYQLDFSLDIKPTERLLEYCRTSMVAVDYDQIYLKMIVFEDGGSTLYAHYNQIIGSRLLGRFSSKATRDITKLGGLRVDFLSGV